MKTAKQFGRRGLPPADAGAPGAGARKRSFGVPMAATGALLTVGLVGGVLALAPLAPGGSQPRNVAAGTAGVSAAQCDPKAGESCARSRGLPTIIYIPGGSGTPSAPATARGGFGATGASSSITSASG